MMGAALPWPPALPAPHSADLSGYHSFAVQWRRPVLGETAGGFDVIANGWVLVGSRDDLAAAEGLAARLNYERRFAPDMPRQLGLDGLPE